MSKTENVNVRTRGIKIEKLRKENLKLKSKRKYQAEIPVLIKWYSVVEVIWRHLKIALIKAATELCGTVKTAYWMRGTA